MEVPLIVFVNTKSGGLQGTKIIDKFKKCIPAENVFDLSQDGPLLGLQKYGGRKFRILVCGGDGSVGWVLTEIEKLKFRRDLVPPVAILPIGTGNDLSRVLKWGGSHPGTKLKNLISKIEKACVVLLDKWAITYASEQPLPHMRHNMHNYLSIGADAGIALQFHEMRLAHPEKFSSRTQNLAWYVRLGLQNFSSELIYNRVSVEINGEKAVLPESTRCVVVLNLPSYSGGGNPWGTKKSSRKSYASQAVDDGLLEVVAVNGPMQLVGIHANIIRGKRLGQGNFVKITTTKAMPAQVDGEPWSQPPSVIEMRLSGKSHVLANSNITPRPESSTSSGTTPIKSIPKEASISNINPVNRTMSTRQLIRTMSSTTPLAHTPSPLTYAPVQPGKRRKGRIYCESCGLEFFLPYMHVNHVKSGLCTGGVNSSGSSKSVELSPPTLSVQVGDSITSSQGDSDDAIWRSQSADISLRVQMERAKGQEVSLGNSNAHRESPRPTLNEPSQPEPSTFATSEVASDAVVQTTGPVSHTDEPTTQSADELTQESAKKPTLSEPAHEPVPEPAGPPQEHPQPTQSTQDFTVEPTPEHIKESMNESPQEESPQEPIQESVQEAVQECVQTPPQQQEPDELVHSTNERTQTEQEHVLSQALVQDPAQEPSPEPVLEPTTDQPVVNEHEITTDTEKAPQNFPQIESSDPIAEQVVPM